MTSKTTNTYRVVTEEILKVAQTIGDGWQVGLRVEEREFSAGSIVPPSRVWVDGEPTNETLDGASALGLRCGSQMDSPVTPQKIAEQLARSSDYCGKYLLLLAGDHAGYGEDPGEVVIADAEVIACWEIE